MLGAFVVELVCQIRGTAATAFHRFRVFRGSRNLRKQINLAALVARGRSRRPARRVLQLLLWRSRENTGGRQRLTPAMQAGIVSELWDMERLYDEVMA